VTWKWRHLFKNLLEVAVEGRKLAYAGHLIYYKAVVRREAVTWQEMTSHDKVTGSDPEVTSFDRKSPGRGCRRPKTGVYCVFDFLQGLSSQEEAVTWQKMTSRDLRSPEETSFDRKSPWSGCRRLKTGVYCAFDFLQGRSSQKEAVTWQEITSWDLRWPKVTRKWRHLTGSHLDVAVEGRKLAYTVCFTSYKAVARRRWQSRDRKWRHVTSSDRKWPGSDVIWPESTGSGCRRPKTGYTVRLTSYKAVARRRRQSRDRKWRHVSWWPQVTRKWRHLTRSHLWL